MVIDAFIYLVGRKLMGVCVGSFQILKGCQSRKIKQLFTLGIDKTTRSNQLSYQDIDLS